MAARVAQEDETRFLHLSKNLRPERKCALIDFAKAVEASKSNLSARLRWQGIDLDLLPACLVAPEAIDQMQLLAFFVSIFFAFQKSIANSMLYPVHTRACRIAS